VGTEPRASCILSKCSLTELYPYPSNTLKLGKIGNASWEKWNQRESELLIHLSVEKYNVSWKAHNSDYLKDGILTRIGDSVSYSLTSFSHLPGLYSKAPISFIFHSPHPWRRHNSASVQSADPEARLPALHPTLPFLTRVTRFYCASVSSTAKQRGSSTSCIF
jgi:hypothetical protein